MPNPAIPNYHIIGRRDRNASDNRGGVIVYARQDVNNIVLFHTSEQAERLWCLVHRDTGSMAICNWYYPPGASLSEIASFETEVAEMSKVADEILVVGDLNVHHKSWLRYSSSDTPRGRLLKELCDGAGICQLVNEPTRKEYLLDLVLSNRSDLKVSVRNQISDHKCVSVLIPDTMETRKFAPRLIWKLADADWKAIEHDLRSQDRSILEVVSVDDAVGFLYQKLDSLMKAHIPSVWKEVSKSNLPWLDTECKAAIAAKHAVEGTPLYEEAAARCIATLRKSRAVYLVKLKHDMQKLPRGSKRWWALNKQLMHRQSSPSLFPPLRNLAGQWCRSPTSKADAFVETWTKKFKLLPETYEHFFAWVPDAMSAFCPIRARTVKRLLKKLRLDQATGPDGLGAALLSRLGDVLCLPIAILTRRIFQEAHWPKQWRLHHVVPLYKRGSRYVPGQYRGIHISNILSKTVERVIGNPLITFLQQYGYGSSQWAYRKQASSRDMVTIYVAQWVLLICRGRKVGLYLSDISGAFDKVSRCLLIGKLSQLGLPSSYLDFLNNFLLYREGRVCVEGALSEAMYLTNMVFQGTVLGPCLWNAFFSDVAHHVPIGDQKINLFADDLSVMASVPLDVSNCILHQELREVQARTHAWGARNQVEFDAGKEYFKIMHPVSGEGDDFRLVGTLFDCKLTMKPCIDQLLGQIRPKIKAIVRLQHLYSTEELLGQYKSHVWSLKEYSNGAVLLAAPTQLQRLDQVQGTFLKDIGISDTVAFINFNFAPPSLRRAIGLLGFLHKRVLGQCHPLVCDALPFAAVELCSNYHNKALHPFTECVGCQGRLFNRSLYAYILIYNRLPQALVDRSSVKNFQAMLTHLAKMDAMMGVEQWRGSFQSLENLHEMFRFRAL